MFRKKFILLPLSIMISFFLISCMKTREQANIPIIDKDKRLIVYTSHKEELYGPIIDEFEARTGIWVQVVSGGTNELLERIADKDESMIADVMFGGGIDSLDSYSEFFEPYRYKNSSNLKGNYKSSEDKWTVFSQLPIVLVYNNKLVYEPEAPRGWTDLMTERWKGKIAFADPNNSGSSYTILNTIMQIRGKEDYTSIETFYNTLGGKILAGSGDVLNEVASGTKLIGITLEETAFKKIVAGGDISIVYPIEGTSAVPDGAAVVLNSNHKENAYLFMEFILGKDVQRLLMEQNYRRSVRSDIDIDYPWMEREINLIDYDLIWAINNRNKIMDVWNELVE